MNFLSRRTPEALALGSRMSLNWFIQIVTCITEPARVSFVGAPVAYNACNAGRRLLPGSCGVQGLEAVGGSISGGFFISAYRSRFVHSCALS